MSKEGSRREIDVYAQRVELDLTKGVGFSLRIVIECKYSREKPWVLLYGNPDKTWLVDAWLRTPRSRDLQVLRGKAEGFSDELADELAKTLHFQTDIPLAHNVVEAHVKNGGKEHDSAYNSLRKICHAAWDTLDLFERGETTWRAMVFPCLVVDGLLFGAKFDPKAGRVRATEIEHGRVCWQGANHGTYVDVVRADALDAYVEKVEASFATIMKVLCRIYENNST